VETDVEEEGSPRDQVGADIVEGEGPLEQMETDIEDERPRARVGTHVVEKEGDPRDQLESLQ
jgi:hypothetical protein